MFTDYYPFLNNLVINAVEAIQSEGNVGVETSLAGEYVEFLVWDDGPGISEADRKLIFQPGFTTKYDNEGNSSTGLGLCHVQNMVHSFNGRITVESTEGKTMFRIHILSKNLLGKESDHETSILYH